MQISLGNFPMIERGPLAILLGGEILLDHEDLQNVNTSINGGRNSIHNLIAFQSLMDQKVTKIHRKGTYILHISTYNKISQVSDTINPPSVLQSALRKYSGEKISNTFFNGGKNTILNSMYIWCGVCNAAVYLIKKWRLSKLDDYNFTLNRFKLNMNYFPYLIRYRRYLME